MRGQKVAGALFLLSMVGCEGGDPKGDVPADDSDSPVDTDVEETPSGDPTVWHTLAEELGGALLSVTGTATNDVWSVGADDGQGPLVLHYDGAAWSREATGSTGDLWWGWVPPGEAAHRLWAVGAAGRVLRLGDGGWDETVTDATITLFGAWGASEDEVWAVGGNVQVATGAKMFRWDGAAWSQVDLPDDVDAEQALYKVWGSSADDVWACGTNGMLLHFDGEGWTRVTSGTDRTLLTLAGDGADDVWAVGGIGNAEIVHWDGAAWGNESPAFARELNGVYARSGAAVAVGRTGGVWWRDEAGAWTEDSRGRATFLDLHAAWLDPDGGVWTVGGSIATLPLSRGILVYGGEDAVAAASL